MDFHLVLGLHLNQRFNVAHQGTNRCTGSDGIVVFADVRQHGIDVIAMERPGTGKTQIHFLETEFFHVSEEFDFLLNGWIARTRALQSITKCFVIKPHAVRMV